MTKNKNYHTPVVGVETSYCAVYKINRVVMGTLSCTGAELKQISLPVGFRPGVELRIPCGSIETGNKYYPGFIYIYTGGNMKCVYHNYADILKDVVDTVNIRCSFGFMV